MLKELDPIAAGLVVGEHSGIIKTDLGYFIIIKTDELLASAYEQRQQSLQQANQLMGKVFYLYQAGKYGEAIPLCEQALPLFEKVFGPDHPEMAANLNVTARLYDAMGIYAKAEPLYQRTLAIFEKTLGPENPAIALTLNNLAFLYARMGFYAKAEPLYQRALMISEKASGRENQDIATMLNNLAGLYYSNGAFAKAKPLYLRALAIAEKTLGPAHPNVAKSLSNLATLYHTAGFYAKAESLYQRAMAIGEKNLAPEHLERAAYLNNLAGVYHSMGAYARAESLYHQALAILTKGFGGDHPEVAQTLGNLGALYKTMGAYTAAESLYQQARLAREKVLGPEHPALAQDMTNLATLYFAMGNYVKAESMFVLALSIRENGLEPDHPDLARSLFNLASFRQAMGSYDETEALYARALKIFAKTLGAEHSLVAKTLSMWANYYQARGFLTQADSLYHEASIILAKVLGPEHRDVAINLNNWALLYSSRRSYARAESLFQHALAITEKNLGPNHPEVAGILSNLAQVYSATGSHTRAEQCSRLALAISEKTLGPEHPDLIKCLNDLAFHWAAMNKIDSVRAIAPRLSKLHFYQYHRVLPHLPERRQLEFMAINSPLPSLWPSLCLEFGAKYHDIQVLSSEVLLNDKGLSLELLAARSHDLKLGDPVVASLRDSLNQVSTQLANLYLSGPKLTTSAAQFMREIQSLGRQQQRLEYALAARGYETAAKSPVTASQVSGALRSDEVLIGFWHFQQYHFASPKETWGNWRYLAFVFQSDHDVTVIDLSAADSIQQSLAELGAAIRRSETEQISSKQQQGELLFKAKGQQLWQLLFKPLLSVIGEKKKIIICADGALHYLPFGVMVDEQNRYLVESYQFHYVSTSREILQSIARGKPARNTANAAVIIADPQFDFASLQIASASASSKSLETEFLTRHSRDWRQMGFGQLKYTRPEAVAIDSSLKHKGIATKLYLQDQAQESVLKNVASPQILHISTHGFFLPDQPELRKPKEIGGFSSIGEFDSTPALENPSLRCGLAFAGANHAEFVNEGEDGLATAMEIAGLDLQGTDLVTLSACLTGVGELRSGEGVFGLHRSFLLAGAKTVVASLWSVPDIETKDLMVEFYRRYLFGEKISKSEALRQAQLAVIEQLRKKYGAAHPAYWGAFVCIGEP